MKVTAFEINNLPKVSLNQIYAGMHWSKRKKLKDDYQLIIGQYFKRKLKGIFSVKYVFYFKSKPLDPTNCAFMVKMIEDCIFDKDSFKDMLQVTIISHKTDKGGDRVVIHVN